VENKMSVLLKKADKLHRRAPKLFAISHKSGNHIEPTPGAMGHVV